MFCENLGRRELPLELEEIIHHVYRNEPTAPNGCYGHRLGGLRKAACT